MCHLARKGRLDHLTIHFVLDNEISKEVKYHFDASRVSYELLPMEGLSFYKSLLKTLIKHKPHLIHFHFISFNILNILLCRLLGVKHLVFTAHDSGSYIPTQPLIERLKMAKRAILLKGVDKIIAVSDFVERRLVNSMKIPQEKVLTIHNGVDLKRFRPLEDSLIRKKQLFGDDDLNVVLCISQLIREKGIHILLKAVPMVARGVENVMFAIVGEGPGKREFEDLARDHGIQDRVRFLGLRSDTESLIAAADVIVCPSIWEEAFGLINIEAMACGVPVVATRVGGIPEIVTDGITGYLVDPGDSTSLTKAIEKILRHKVIRSSFGQMGLKRAQNLFDLDVMIYSYLKLYKF